jgi:hypothetical protein
VELAPNSVREWKILDPAVGSGHFLVVALGLLLALFQEEAKHRGLQGTPEWSQKAIVEHLLAHTLHGIDIDPRAVQIAAASLWLKGKSIRPEIEPEQLNLVAPNLRLADLPDDDPALVELRSDIEVETGIAGEFTTQILQALRGADHLGSLLKIDQAVDAAIDRQERRLKGLRIKAQEVQLDITGGVPPVQEEMDFSAAAARADIQELLEQFLAHHSSASDLGLRLKGEQLASGIRFVRSLSPSFYDLVIANPPYQGNGKIFDTHYIEEKYALGKAELYASFLLRTLDLARPAGLSALLSPRDWMSAQQYTGLRESVLAKRNLTLLADLGWGSFKEIKDVRVCMSVWRKICPASLPTIVLAPTGVKPSGRTLEDYEQKASGLLLGVERFSSVLSSLSRIKEWPLIYWWKEDMLTLFDSYQPLGERCPVRNGLSTQDNTRFLRSIWEVKNVMTCVHRNPADSDWALYIKGAAGRAWLEDARDVIRWVAHGIEVKVFNEAMYGSYSRTVKNEKHYFEKGVAFSLIGDRFTARIHRYSSVFGHMGASVFPGEENLESICCTLNSSKAQYILSSLNPGVHFLVGDVNRIPFFEVSGSDDIANTIRHAFELSEVHREASIEFVIPGPSPWQHAQEWAQQAVDRPEGSPLPEYIEEVDPEPPTDHLSFALGIALGRFAPVDEQGQPTTSNQPGILDPAAADLSHALPAGILFLDGSLEENDHRDDLGTAAAAPLHQAWSCYGSAIAPNRSLRDWLRLDFFKDVHKGMYENRPIHWPLSSSSKTFVAWVNIHRLDERTLKELLAEHLIPVRTRIYGELDVLRQVRDSKDRKEARAADTRIGKLTRWREELQEFIAAVEHCADHGAPPTDGRCPTRKQDAVYAPDLDDGVMINSAALWPLLEPQWKDPKKWWKELASAQGKKDYDWAHLAIRYWPSRVDEKCQGDPSLAVAHGCFWRYHPERAWAWELRMQQEIAPDFRIEEAPYRPGGKDLGDEGDAPHRLTWLSDHPAEALAAVEKEATRRMGRGDNRQVVNEMRILETGLWSVIPEKVAAMEQRLSDKQGEVFSLRAPDEAEGRTAIGEQAVQPGLALALGGSEGAGA